jgi:hypothetical protein
LVRTEGIEPNRQPPSILRQEIYSLPLGTARILKHTRTALGDQPSGIEPSECASIWALLPEPKRRHPPLAYLTLRVTAADFIQDPARLCLFIV